MNFYRVPRLHYCDSVVLFKHGEVLLHATHEALLLGRGTEGFLLLLWWLLLGLGTCVDISVGCAMTRRRRGDGVEVERHERAVKF